jgi:hypothetical protein
MRQPCAADKLVYAKRMLKRWMLTVAVLAALVFVAGGCSTHSGSREYVPGKGWIYND